MIPEWVDHMVLGVCQAPIAATLVWLTARGKWLVVNPTVQVCLTLSWAAYVFHHLTRVWPHHPDLDAWTMHVKAVLSMPLVLFIWPMFRRADALPDRVEYERRMSDMSTVLESQRADNENTAKKVRAIARVCKVQLDRNRQELDRLKADSASATFLARAEMLNGALAEVLATIKASGLDSTDTPEARANGAG